MKHLAAFSTWPTQNQQLEALYRLIEANRVPHAILLVGKETSTTELAEFLAKLLLCTGDAAPCGICESCRQFAAESHPDYVVVAGVDGTSIKTAQIEEIQSRLKVRSHHGGASVYVITEIDTATPVAANRLLKTLEEPSSSIKAILTTSSPGRLLPTIRSRLFAYSLNDTGSDNEEESTLLSSTGKGAAVALDDEFVSSLEPVIKWTYSWLAKREPSLVLAASLLDISGSAQAADVLDRLALWLRELVHLRAGIEPRQFSSYHAELAEQARLASHRQLAQATELVTQAKSRLQAHVAANLNFEQLCIRLRGVL